MELKFVEARVGISQPNRMMTLIADDGRLISKTIPYQVLLREKLISSLILDT